MGTQSSPRSVRAALRRGMVIPAHPLALTAHRKLDERRQRALTRYYLAAGAGGVAVGVHTTQFKIHDPGEGLYRPVLGLAREVIREQESSALAIAGVIGPTRQAVAESVVARELGYDVALVSLGGLDDWSTDRLIEHLREVAAVLPLMGFYLQPAVGGRVLDHSFWRRVVTIENLVGIKVAPFNRYRTLDVVRAVVESGRAGEIALYTGNDDHIVLDLVTPFRIGGNPAVRFVGGLLGQWACWTHRAVQLLASIRRSRGRAIPPSLLSRAVRITEANAAIFDVANDFRGSISGIHEVLRRQGLLRGTWCLDPEEQLSRGQRAAIDRIYTRYPDLTDDAFVAERLDSWLD